VTTTAEPLHGYTLRELDRLARSVIAIDRWDRGDADERHDAVLYALVEHLLTADDAPTRRDLIRLGARAADRHVRDELHHHGWDLRDYAAGSGAMAAFQRYWQASPTPSPEESVIEQIARQQIWPHLSPDQQDALNALAEHGDYQDAADAVGCSLHAFYQRIQRARSRALALYWEGETPRRGWWDRRRRTEPTQLRSVSVHIRRRRHTAVAA
jgi:DNA-directed RNA polymerase specialized sigma24 family protein